MKRFNSIFWRFFTTNASIVLFSFLILAGSVPILVSDYVYRETIKALDQNGKMLSTVISDNLVNYGGEYGFSDENFERSIPYLIEAFSNQYDAEAFLVDENGVVQFTSIYPARVREGDAVPVEYLNRCRVEGSLLYTGDLGEIYGESYYITCNIVLRPNREFYGFIFVNAPSVNVAAFRLQILQNILLVALAALVVSFAAILFITNRMVSPLRNIAKAVKKFGDGDFSSRVQVTAGGNEIAHLREAFNNMADSIAADEGMRKSFIANVSHELRTPMTNISGFVDGMLDKTIPEEQYRHYLGIVSSETKRLSRLIRTMLDLSRIDSDTLELRVSGFDLRDVILTTLFSFENKIEEKRVSIEGLEDSRPLMLEGDADLLHQVVYNLIENAVKFVNDGGTVTIKMSESKDSVTVNIRNTGNGIAEKDRSRIFERFYKTDKSRSQDAKGLGLGLYIVKTVIRLHSGKIYVNGEVGSHTEFEFTLPKKAAQKGLGKDNG